MLPLNDTTDPHGLLRNLRDMGASDDVITIFGTMNPQCAAEIMLFIADFGQRLVREDREKRAIAEKPKPRHVHTATCYLSDDRGLIYKPHRADGLDANLTHLKKVDFDAGLGISGLTLTCPLRGREPHRG